ncbi:hypothetical protein Gbem_2855 [Citrifermentans bemidjiense Bem]|uniref:YkgJ family cysteine cluster protein n=1 Tax=Citrifermentans bemidjiense (strain ATCC BAA-1014 / DSM 16622 / JCM 12645 / Bem) TaxID=404380 RepID=B5EIF7_CITBB|nr:YkgJ family cysteine cluster protein [Citrifermentans bemidjiense]ACH39859.1 hypothetical protein Gbem_2855 [Citrifermentans bemidjiense Bem]
MGEMTWQAERFAAALREKLQETLGREPSLLSLNEALTACSAAAEKVCAGRPMACAPGCPSCCVLNVAVLLPEAILIAMRLRKTLPPSELSHLQRTLSAHRSWTRWMDDEERIIKRAVCPFLDSYGSCCIHEVRPLACRGAASLDADCCRKAFSPIITDDPRLVPADLLRQAAYDEAFSTLGKALKSSGLDDRSIELGTGVLAFLEEPEYLELFSGRGRLPDSLWR